MDLADLHGPCRERPGDHPEPLENIVWLSNEARRLCDPLSQSQGEPLPVRKFAYLRSTQIGLDLSNTWILRFKHYLCNSSAHSAGPELGARNSKLAYTC